MSSPIPADQRTCYFCNNSEIEDEPHLFFSCKQYVNNQQTKILKFSELFFSSSQCFGQVLFVRSVNDNKLHHLLGAFIYEAFKHQSAQLRV